MKNKSSQKNSFGDFWNIDLKKLGLEFLTSQVDFSDYKKKWPILIHQCSTFLFKTDGTTKKNHLQMFKKGLSFFSKHGFKNEDFKSIRTKHINLLFRFHEIENHFGELKLEPNEIIKIIMKFSTEKTLKDFLEKKLSLLLKYYSKEKIFSWISNINFNYIVNEKFEKAQTAERLFPEFLQEKITAICTLVNENFYGCDLRWVNQNIDIFLSLDFETRINYFATPKTEDERHEFEKILTEYAYNLNCSLLKCSNA